MWLVLGFCSGSCVDLLNLSKRGLEEKQIASIAKQSLKVG